MSESRKAMANLFIAFAEALNSMNDRDYDLLIMGKAKLRLVESRKAKDKPLEDLRLGEAVSEVAQGLNDAESRAAAKSLIESIDHPRKREFLVKLAEACKVRVMSKDTITMIEQKLIENVVGSKLSSQAIKKVLF